MNIKVYKGKLIEPLHLETSIGEIKQYPAGDELLIIRGNDKDLLILLDLIDSIRFNRITK